MASITLNQTRAVDENGYSVTTTVTAAEGIPPEIFVYDSTGVYNHIATVDDLGSLGTETGQGAFYRMNSVTQVFDDVNAAINAAAVHKWRVSELVTDYTACAGMFVGSELTTYTA